MSEPVEACYTRMSLGKADKPGKECQEEKQIGSLPKLVEYGWAYEADKTTQTWAYTG